MFELMIKRSISAAHRLKEYGGKCENLHGHNWRIDVFIRAKELDETGLALDFRIMKQKTDEVLKELDHTYLNELPCFEGDNPSSERIAQYIFKRLSKLLNDGRARVSKVTAWESDTACASFEDEI
jgi:6-pyruvoyltetrahydropterin/6-carboxytetrahydropterin synthase